MHGKCRDLTAIADNGSFTLTDKKNGRAYRDLGVYENTGDIGNEYMYKQPDGETALTTSGLTRAYSRVPRYTFRFYEIVHEWEIPASADELLDEEQRRLVYFGTPIVLQAQRSDAHHRHDGYA